jgi:hypothetical protein
MALLSTAMSFAYRRGHRFRRNIGKEVVYMAYGNAEERSSLIAGLRDLADFLESNPEVSAPRWADVMVFPPHSTDIEMKEAINTIAALIGTGISDETAQNGHYTASRQFGLVHYKAVGIRAQSLARRAAQLSCTENIFAAEQTEEA